ncbi:MAG: hypothetical protein VKS61_03925 [Candidatus Sericytochromatia bacterium]|nr:hypothetical protein [Candidatus Sericytochromatia bacterium]
MRATCLALIALALAAPSARAEAWDQPPQPSRLEAAALRVRDYLATVPGLPADLVVLPAAGEILWPGSPPTANVRAEVWVVVPRDKPEAAPLMMFAVRPATGDIYALYLSNVQEHPRYR